MNVSASPAHSPAYTRTPLFDNEKGLKYMHFPLILPSCVPLAAISRPLIIILFSVCLRSPILIYRAMKSSAYPMHGQQGPAKPDWATPQTCHPYFVCLLHLRAQPRAYEALHKAKWAKLLTNGKFPQSLMMHLLLRGEE
jgi:hypothetical protein